MSNNRKKTEAAAEVKEEAKTEEVKVEEVKAEEPAETTEPVKAGEKDTRKMYVGPTVVDFAIQNRVYTDIPEAAKAKITDQPELGNLFIEILDYPKANKMLRERTGYIYSAYMKALELRK